MKDVIMRCLVRTTAQGIHEHGAMMIRRAKSEETQSETS
jgi:hypothetical protein